MVFSEEQTKRYSRHFVLDEIGKEGQERLLNARVLIIGAGGLGSPAAMYLASAGVGTIGIVDADTVDISNIQRQIIHTAADVGRLKALSAKESIKAVNPDTKVNIYAVYAHSGNIEELIKDYDFVLDCTDKLSAKLLINDACVIYKKPFCHGGAIRFQGQLMTYLPDKSPCYRCLFREPPADDEIPGCKQVGVVGAVCGVIGSMQAMEAIKYFTDAGKLLTGSLLTYNGLTMKFRKISFSRDKENCPVCGVMPSVIKPGE